jgi:hypothetical protein
LSKRLGDGRLPEDQPVLVVVHALGECEMLAVEGGQRLPIADGQRDVIELHPASSQAGLRH